MRLIIDRIENNTVYAENEDCEIVKIDISGVSGNVREGAVLTYTENGYTVDEEATEIRRSSLRERFKRFFKR